MGRIVLLLASLLLLLHQCQSQEEQTYGELTFQCKRGWSIYQTNCYLPVQAALTYNKANLTCNRQGGELLQLENDLEYTEFVSTLTEQDIWLDVPASGLQTFPLWGNYQPDNAAGSCVSISKQQKARFNSCEDEKTFVCKYEACLKDYVQCATGGKCFHKSYLCDGTFDCPDQSDERECPTMCRNYIQSNEVGGSFTSRTQGDYSSCTWIIEVPPHKRLSINIPAMTLETDVAHMKVYSGSPSLIGEESRLLVSLTGNVPRQTLYANNNFLIISFITDDILQTLQGYFFSWTTAIPELHDGIKELAATSTISTLTFPFNTQVYDLTLVWLIKAGEKDVVTFYLEGNVDDSNSYGISYRDGDEVMTYERLKVGEYRTTGTNKLFIRMVTAKRNKDVFLKYKTGCNMTINTLNGSVYSPGSTLGKIPNSITCEWILLSGTVVQRGMTVKFNQLNMHTNDTLQVFIDANPNATTPVLYGDSTDNIIHAEGGKIRVHLQTDAAIKSTGFTVTFGADCDTIQTSQWTMLSLEKAYFQETVEVLCQDGYGFDDETHIASPSFSFTCDDPSKSVCHVPVCIEIQCGAPPGILNGYIVSINGTTLNSTAVYGCNNGFSLQPEGTPTCTKYRIWSNLPSCTSTQCNVAPASFTLNNGRAIIRAGNATLNTTSSAQYGTVVEFQCNEGYYLVGPKYTRCIGSWSHEDQRLSPSCEVVKCPVLSQSNVEQHEPISYGSTGNVLSCKSGYMFPNTGGNRTLPVTCQSNGTLSANPNCININECLSSGTCPNNSTCTDIVGSFMCTCHAGYVMDGDICSDIDECSTNVDGCLTMNSMHYCQNTEGSYTCTCPVGWKLFTTNGQSGYYLPSGQTGFQSSDTFRFNHTCVRTPFTLGTLTNGKYLTIAKTHYYGDNVFVKCNDGYIVTGSSPVSNNITITASVSGFREVNCSARTCSVPTNVARGTFNRNGTISFGESVTLTCTLSATYTITKTAYCIYENSNSRLGGQDVTSCPEIDCGDPDLIMPSGATIVGARPTVTTYPNGSFTIACASGFTLNGSSGQETNNKIVCKANGKWHLGNLTCMGARCPDPGTPADARQVVSSYEVGQNVSFSCNRIGFKPDKQEPQNYTCQLNTVLSTSSWTGLSTLPVCRDATPPTVNNCPEASIYVETMGVLSFTEPSFTDNFAVKSITKSDVHQSGDFIDSPIQLTYEATDFESNLTPCTMIFQVIDRTVRPVLTCPSTIVLNVPITNMTTTTVTTIPPAVSTSWAGQNPTLIPSTVSASYTKIGSYEPVVATLTDEHGRETKCPFVARFQAGACFSSQIHIDSFASRNCSSSYGSSVSCLSTCNAGSVYRDGLRTKTFSCSSASSYSFVSEEEFCLPYAQPKQIFDVNVTYQIDFDSNLCTLSFNESLKSSIGRFTTNLRSQCSSSWSVSSDFTLVAIPVTKYTVTYHVEGTALSSDGTACMNAVTASTFDLNSQAFTCQTRRVAAIAINKTSTLPQLSCAQAQFTMVSSVELGNICVPCSPGQFYNSTTSVCTNCPEGRMQNLPGQTQCKECLSGQQPNAAKTACIVSCPVGFFSTTGTGECIHCPENKYSTSPTLCTDCPVGYSTVGRKGAKSSSECYAPCPAGQFSSTGYNDTACRPCPIGTYQPTTGQRTCTRCSAGMKTTLTGSVTAGDCVNITDECNRNYCGGRGQCDFRLNRRHCTCDNGYSGDTCQKTHHICDSNPCKNGATCIPGSTFDSYTCTCRSDLDTMELFMSNQSGPSINDSVNGYYKLLLSTTLSTCQTTCLREDACLSMTYLVFGSPLCYLYNSEATALTLTMETRATTYKKSKGFSGTDCEIDLINDCTSNQCDASAMCMNKIGGYQCLCPVSGGLTGQYCKDTRNPCSPNPCVHGSCQPFGNIRYECTCNPGWKGINCTEDIDECSYLGADCLYGGTCIDNPNGFTCNCPAQYTGLRCQTPPNFCAQMSCTGNLCYNSLDDRMGKCYCDGPIYTPNGNTCNRTEPCAAGIINCGANGECRNNGDSASCTCKAGYAGLSCEHNVNYCQASSCNGHGTCVDGEGTNFTCVCFPGYAGTFCADNIDDCLTNNNCDNGAACIDGINTHTCQCPPGFTGPSCEIDIDECASIPCKNGGTCASQINSYNCTCPMLYTGRNCQTAINTCSPQPCLNGAPCFNLDNSRYFCSCAGGTQGENCETLYDVCKVLENDLVCGNSGRCQNSNGTAICKCPVETNIDYCYFDKTIGKTVSTGSLITTSSLDSCLDTCKRNTACQSASVTKTISNTYLCRMSVATVDDLTVGENTDYYKKICPLLYDGAVCELINDACTPNPCLNQGICTKRQCGEGFTCQCAPGYTGIRCETRDDPCISALCGTTATCTSSLTEYICQCPQGKVLVGTSCRTSSTSFVIMGNSLNNNEAPKLKWPFRLEGTAMSIMLRFRIHQYNESSVIATIQLQDSFRPEEAMTESQTGLQLMINTTGVMTIYNGFPHTYLWNSPSNAVKLNPFDKEWHHLGISISSESLILTMDAITINGGAISYSATDEVNFAYNGQIILGSNILAEYKDVVVWNTSVPQMDFNNAFENEMFYPRTASIVQHWWNYYIPQASERQTAKRSTLLSLDTTRGMEDVLDCSNIQDVFHVPPGLLVNIEQVGQVTVNKNAVKNQATNGRAMKQTLPTVMTVGYYPGVLVRTKTADQPLAYDYCKFGLYIKYNDVCPNPRYEGTSDSCSGGVCRPSCAETNSHLSAPTPNDMACGSLGVWNLGRPKQPLVLPSCQVYSLPKYVVDVDATLLLQISCAASFASAIKAQIETNFYELRALWPSLCSPSTAKNCTNINVTMSACLPNTKNLKVKFYVAFSSAAITKTNETEEVQVEDVLRLIIMQEDALRVNAIAGGIFLKDTVNIVSSQKCEMRGDTLIRRGANNIVCVPCGQGFYVNETTKVCTPCDLGKYQTGIQAETCTSCNQGLTTYQFGARAAADCVIRCPVGHFYNFTTSACAACPRNTYQQRTGESHCEPCTVGYRTVGTGSNRSDDCKVDCPGGQYRNENLVCTMCPRGTYRNVEYDECQPCPNNKTTMENLMAISINNCSMDICNLGSYWNTTDSRCKLCPVGQYADVQYLLECKHCQVNHSTRNNGTESGNDCTFYCQPGYEVVDGACKPCPRGKYKSADMRFDVCAPCASGQTTEKTGSQYSENCSLPLCTSGQYIVNSTCTNCSVDTYSSVELPDSLTRCVPCKTAYGTQQPASTSADQCKPVCSGGQEFNATTMACQLCPVEKFKPNDDRFGSCRNCSDNKVASMVGATSADNCTIPNCQAGYKIFGSGCEACPIGTYQSNVRSTECVDCGSNLSTASNGTTSFKDCLINCDPGFYGQDVCVPCPEQHYKNETGFANCMKCPPGTTSPSSRLDCSLTYCTFGYRYNVTSCVPCDVGTYKGHEGNNATCTPCVPGTTTNGTGQKECAVLNCVPGKYAVNGTCQSCPMGTYKNVTGNEACMPCAVNFTTETTGAISSAQCDTVVCPIGKYRMSSQKTNCTPCGLNAYQNVSGTTSCRQCPSNKVTMQEGSISEDDCVPLCLAGNAFNRLTNTCYNCSRGTYKPVSGNTNCTECQNGKTTLGVASKYSTECSQVVCPKGTYEKIVFSTIVCEVCPVGQYSDAVMQDNCTSCTTTSTERKTTLSTGTTSSLDCIAECDAGYGYDTTLSTCQKCPVNFFNNKTNPYPNTCKKCPNDRTNTISGSALCPLIIQAPVSPPVQMVSINIPVTYELNVDSCDSFETTLSAIVLGQVRDKVKRIFEEKAATFTNNWCNGAGCLNIDVIYLTCAGGSANNRRKRALVTAEFEFIFQNISKLVTDFSNGANIETKEILAQTLKLKARSLDLEGGINYVRFGTFNVSELCLSGQYRSGSNCMFCNRGTYSVIGETGQCTPCQQNYYQDVIGATSCKPCPVQKFTANNGSASIDLCILHCAPGQYSVDGRCQPCPMGTFKNATGNQTCTACADGFTTGTTGANNSAQCDTIICPIGNYRVSSQKTVCTPCSVNTYQNVSGSTSCKQCPINKITMQQESQSEDECVPLCTAGNAFNRITNTCYNCPRGTYKTSSGNTNCTECQPGKTTYGVASTSPNDCSQVVCPKGTYGKTVNSAVVCELCPVGKYSDAEMQDDCTNCTTATERKTTLTTGTTTNRDCIADCDPGHGYDTTLHICQICQVNFFNNKTGPYPNTCKQCPKNRTNTITGSTGCSLTVPDPVNLPVQFVTVTVTTTYQLNVDSCETLNVTASQIGVIIRTQIKDKVIRTFEDKATGFTNDWCNGTGCPNIDVTFKSCSNSPSAKRRKRALVNAEFEFIFRNISKLVTDTSNGAVIWTKEILAQTLMVKARSFDIEGGITYIGFDTFVVTDLCLSGQYRNGTECLPCLKGTYSLIGDSTQCTPCPLNYYQDLPGAANCKPCPAPKYTDDTGSDSSDLCKLQCVSGQYPVGGACQPCPLGLFKNTTGNQTCTACTDGFTTGTTGATNASHCDTVICPVGKYRVSSQKTVCTPCGLNTYQNVSGSTSCRPCPENKVTLQQQSQSENDCVPLCLAGRAFDINRTTCYDCPRGTYKTSSGNTNCTECQPGKTTYGVASTSPNDCSQVICPMGTYGKTVNSTIMCELCPVGKYSDAIMQDNCTSCTTATERKTTLTSGSTTSQDCIADCDAGSGYDTTMKACQICQVNFFNNKTVPYPNTCKQCPNNRTNTRTGSTSCSLPISDPVTLPVQLVTIVVNITYQLDVDSCQDFTGTTSQTSVIVHAQVKDKVKKIFEEKTAGFTNNWCNGAGCSNIDVTFKSCSAATVSTRKKRALVNAIFELNFRNISKLVTDSANGAIIQAKEILAQTLVIKARSLDLAGGITYIGFGTFVVSELCLPGQYSSGLVCLPCPQGTYSISGENTQCTKCALNYYQDLIGAADCKPCPAPKYTDNIGSNSSDLCKAPCAAGYAYNRTSLSCYSCPVGTYKSNVNNALECTACPVGRSTITTSSTSLNDCSRVICPVGTYAQIQSGTTICMLCPVGTYNDEVMQDQCKSCNTTFNNRTTQTEGSVSNSQCIPICNAGWGFNNTERACQPCSQGYYNNREGSNPNTCKKCSAGTTNLAAGSSTCLVQDATPVGTVLVSVEVTLTYKVDAASCAVFNENTTRVSVVRNQIINKIKQILRARAGNKWCSDADCSNIMLGKLECPNSQSGRRKRALVDVNFPITVNNVSETSQISGEDVPTTDVLAQALEAERLNLNIDDGITFEGYSTIQTTEVCKPGHFKANTQCVPCARGTYSTDGQAATCSPCPVNKYQDQTGQAQCKDCEGFKYLDQTGSTNPNDCKLLCETDITYCNNRGVCVDTGLKQATCQCNPGFEGNRCASKTETESEIKAILGASIGGVGALLLAVLLIVGIFKCLTSRQKSPKKPHISSQEDYIYDNRFPSYYTGSLQSRKLPAIGYPAMGFIQDPRLHEEAYSQMYNQAPSVHDQQDDSPTFVWRT